MNPVPPWIPGLALLLVAVPAASAHRLDGPDGADHVAPDYDPAARPPAVAHPAATDPRAPAAAAIFRPFAPKVRTRWDDTHLYVESDGMPDHRMMVGIRAWQQQVPIPQRYVGANAWRLPLVPVPARRPLSARDNFFRGAIAIAANGVPIFNPIKNDGRTDTLLAGELDEFGGHAGRADDYHYHIAPVHLQEAVGAGRPVAYALDGYAIHGLTCGDGKEPDDLDAFNGHTTADLGYHYHASRRYPYLNGGFRGEVVERDGQVDPQPRASGPRPATAPLRGATITDFRRTDAGFQVAYRLQGSTRFVNYAPQDGGWRFEFVAADGTTRTEHHDGSRRGGDEERVRGARDRRDDAKGRREPTRTAGRQPWILAHAREMDADGDGRLSRAEVAAEVAKTFAGYDADADGKVPVAGLASHPPVRSALGGFLKEHAAEIDADHDTTITERELGAVVLRMFDRAARDGSDLPATAPAPERKGAT